MIKKLNQKFKANSKETTTENKSKYNNITVGASNAITLIALVITIIVLLILVGVTINLVIGPEGLLKQAQDATDKYKQAENQEQNSMSNLLAQLESINNGNGEGIETPTEPDNTINPGEPERPVEPIPPAGEVTKTEDNIKYTSDGEGNIVPVPVGFSYLEGTNEIGFVIKNDKDLNEFVWIPVKDMSYSYDRYVVSIDSQIALGLDAETNSTKIRVGADYCVEAMPDDEQTSVNKYGGYYIARYEAGISTQRTSHTSAITLPKFQKSTSEKIIYAYNYLTRDEAKSLSSRLYNKSKDNITSKLCSSYAWDTALRFIETKVYGYAQQSYGGNYSASTLGTGKLQPTGYHCVNNIYDMGGNVEEWTTEVCISSGRSCVARGGNYASDMYNNSAGWRFSNTPVGNSIKAGFRVALFL